jgi:hypothetical protein
MKAEKRKKGAEVTSLAKVPPKKAELFRAAQGTVQNGLTELANLLSGKLAAPRVAAIYEYLGSLEKTVGALKEAGRGRVLGLLQESGKKATEAGTLQLQEAGWLLEARPTGGGFDDRKVEALIRARGLDPARFMDTVITYKLRPSTIEYLQSTENGGAGITADELETCRRDRGWAVQTPKKLEEE